MEDVLDVYHRPRDPECPVVCLDETSKQLIAETRVPIPAKPGRPGRIDYEYERNGTANIFMLFAPLEGRRHVEAGGGLGPLVRLPHRAGVARWASPLHRRPASPTQPDRAHGGAAARPTANPLWQYIPERAAISRLRDRNEANSHE
jgi:hypothetical protein